MAALLLSAAGSTVGRVFGSAGAIAGRLVGALAGNAIDQALFGGRERNVTGPRLSDLEVMASTDGASIPRVYGRARLAGQMIWATNLEEVVTTESQTTGGGKGMGGSRTTTNTTTYSYYANIALGLCEGKISAVRRVWADGKPLDLSGLTMRVYRGDETQTPDPLIVAKEGQAPAYRGLAYVVFERLPLEDFGNRIPQLTFEVVRAIGKLETMTRAVTLIPGSTEFGYAPSTVVQVMGPGTFAAENRHVSFAPSDIVASLDELQAVAPNLESVAIVVAWFGDDLRCGTCRIRPGIDNAVKQTDGVTHAIQTWVVAGVDRASAYVVSQHDGRAAYGGTPSDQSVRDLIAHLKARGLKVTLYPFVMMDIAAGNTRTDPYSGAGSQPLYPWRGRITCEPAPGVAGSPDGTATAADQVNAFFSGGPDGWNYRAMILHYAALAQEAGGVDAFLIGSELKALTRVRSASGVYPAVNALVALAAEVRAIVGGSTRITYGADWTEYGAHVVDAGASEVRFPLDALWASPNIDCVGIDYYAPLADWRDEADALDRELTDSPYRVDYLADGLKSGEAYDWYYVDDAARLAQERSAITDGLGKPWMFRQKDIWSFWSQLHHERVGGAELPTPTAWLPQSKPIWFTELGCPAVDKGANAPNVFPDPKSSESALPYFSNGQRDDLIQRRFLEAVLGTFDPDFGDASLNPVSSVYGGRMIAPGSIYLWTWDARPYPVFPAASDVWGDAGNWNTGHWLTGRLGSAPLDALVSALCADSGIANVDARDLGEGPEGYAVDRTMTPRAMLDPLALAFAFDAVEQDGVLRFRQRGGVPVAELTEDDLVLPDDAAPVRLTRAQDSDLPRQVSLAFTEIGTDYQRATAMSRRLVGASTRNASAELAMVWRGEQVERRANIWLQDLWATRERASFALPPSRLVLTPGDVAAITVNGRRRLIEIEEIADAESRAITARSIDPEVFNMALSPPGRQLVTVPAPVGPPHAIALDLPNLNSETLVALSRLAVFADPWPGAVAVWASRDGASFTRAALATAPCVIGETLDDLVVGPTARWHRTDVRVRIYGGALSSASDLAVLNGANAAALRNADGVWEVIQFAEAELIGERTYRLSKLLRGQAGSEWAMAPLLAAGAPFVLLDGRVVTIASGSDARDRTMQLRVVAAGRDTADAAALALDVTPQSTALKPLAPVHLRAARDAAGVTLRWIRRTRTEGDSWSGEVPLGEDSEAYEIDIMSGSTVKRTLTAATPSLFYAAADEIADFGAAQTSLTVRIAQLSATVGRGFTAQATFRV
ncbi:glycoside hydrolase/phage tail family protein [Pseudolabrys sp. FHR47]|uniref:baseplate multidomain protein megatron n=1 Tax=Pseudolabrys sp. FHR47 TaxID=2562284 RepID=UPI0010BE55AB|nr:glycoside hydrolase/phage tail family protein [Pseudolabrys sp. FHR47]